MKKEKFKPVIGNGEEAVIHITSEIATEIEVDKNGKVISYPDYGAFNQQDEFYYGGKLYSKEILIKGKKKSPFPTFKVYIYRGNTEGEAIKKLKQDIKFNTHENAEDTVLEIARHSAKNLNYKKSGPVPPNTLENLYRIKYSKAENKKHKVSYRYRIVDNNSTNFPVIENYKDEYVKGAMNLGSRTSISIDPWLSDSLEGCIGLRGVGGSNHPSCEETIKKQDKENYKYIYHSINNYLEDIIPELTGVYGRRGFSSSSGTTTVNESTYKEEINVFVLVDHLPDIDECALFVDNRRLYYKSFGSKAVKYIEKNSTANKFKALYMVGQRRAENGFRLKTKGNNPMNIKGKGDLGIVVYETHETINGVYVSRKGKFANFSTEDAGFNGYLKLLESNYNDAYKALYDNNSTIDDFVNGLQDTGKMGVYATGRARKNLTATEAYKEDVKSYFEGAKNDYIKIYECLIKKAKDDKIRDQLKIDLELIKEIK
ncbi:hypothetical protein BWK59_12590 [Flavobacterium davisii]|uniref:Uncharacterized protein n=1 Tax=Flavobacterium davisii TaxID=2906077 RepID=A0A246GFX6_9FLAO|nr:hypothetical protein BWK59_12590 [Flavobacterium davisii]